MAIVTTSDGVRLHVEEAGEGPALVLIAGLGGSATFWSSIGPLLSRSYRVIAFDHRGAGRSDRPPDGYSIDRIAGDVVEILDRLDIGKAHIVGHSTGGAIAQVLALDAADRVGRIVLSATWEKADYRFRKLFGVRAAVLEACGPQVYQDLTHLMAYQPAWVNEHSDPLDAASRDAGAALEPLAVSIARINMLCEFDRSADLATIAAPTLVVGAVDDGIVPFHHSQALASAIPGARLISFSGGHFFPRLNPGEYADAIAAFLNEGAGAGR